LTLGGCASTDGKSPPRVLLLSGPNMGKSIRYLFRVFD